MLVPVLGRPHRVRPLLDSLAAATPEPHRVLFLVDPRDAEEHAAIDAAAGARLTVAGNYAVKINVGIMATSEPLIFTGADDLHFHPGWLAAARAKLAAGVGVVGTNDMCNGRVLRGEHSTHSLVARWYAQLGTIDESGKLLHEAYPHEFVDDELVATARYRGMYAHAHDSLVEHLHPDAAKAPIDDLYAARPRRMRAGRRIFWSREHLWT